MCPGKKSSSRESLGESLLDIVPTSEVKELFVEYGEFALDATLEDGVIKDIPFLGTMVKIYGAVHSIRDRVFIKKLAAFMRNLESVSDEDRKKYIAQLENKGQKREFGEAVIQIVDDQRSYYKAGLVGGAFALLMKHTIDELEFNSLLHVITLVNTEYIWCLDSRNHVGRYLNRQTPPEIVSSLLSLGLLIERDDGSVTPNGPYIPRKLYAVSRLGGLLLLLTHSTHGSDSTAGL